MTDPFDQLAVPAQPRRPRTEFTRNLRARLEAELGLAPAAPSTGPDRAIPTITPSPRRSHMSAAAAIGADPTPTSTPTSMRPIIVTPYLAVAGAAAALDFYRRAFGAVEHHRVVGPDGTIGHAELTIGSARFFLSDAYPDLGVRSPADLDGTTITLHLEVADADGLFARAVEAGATGLSEPADQPHGSRHGTLVDPYGHRWMLSQTLVPFDLDRYRDELGGSGWSVTPGPDAGTPGPNAGTAGPEAGIPGPEAGTPVDQAIPAPRGRDGNGHIWAAVNATDAPAMIRFMADVLGFSEQLIVPDAEPGKVAHSQLRWSEGGVVQVGSADRSGNIFSQRPTGTGSLYVITVDPGAVLARCRAAEVEIVAEPHSADHDPEGMVFTVRDHEGNLWSFGTYRGVG